MSEFYADGVNPSYEHRKSAINQQLGIPLDGGLLGRLTLGLDSADVSVVIPIDTDTTPRRIPGIRREDVDEILGALAGTLPRHIPKVEDTNIFTVVDGEGKFEPAVTTKVRAHEETTLADWAAYLATRPVELTAHDKELLNERKFGSFGAAFVLGSVRRVFEARIREQELPIGNVDEIVARLRVAHPVVIVDRDRPDDRVHGEPGVRTIVDKIKFPNEKNLINDPLHVRTRKIKINENKLLLDNDRNSPE